MAMDFWKWAYLIGIIIILLVVLFSCYMMNAAWNDLFG
jgi:hypothetical protein